MKMPMDLTEVKLRRKDVFEGKIMTVHVDDVRLPNGEEATREVVDHVDGAAVLALDEANRGAGGPPVPVCIWQGAG